MLSNTIIITMKVKDMVISMSTMITINTTTEMKLQLTLMTIITIMTMLTVTTMITTLTTIQKTSKTVRNLQNALLLTQVYQILIFLI
jgi:hypothetical protein